MSNRLGVDASECTTDSLGSSQVALHASSTQDREIMNQIQLYILERSSGYVELEKLRKKGWASPEGDKFFQKQRQNADKDDDAKAAFFFTRMQYVARELHRKTEVLSLEAPEGAPTKILDMCMAPGSFLRQAKCFNPEATARAFTLPPEDGGHKVLLPQDQNTDVEYLDIAMLAEDMGVPLESIPPTHPDARNFLSRRLSDDEVFDLVLCDGQVLRTHPRKEYRERREATRLNLVQLSIGLSHIRPGGTMLILLHRIESLKCVQLLRTFSAFSTIQVAKPQSLHANRSSCYLVAKNINPKHVTALSAVETWRQLWKSVTFDTEEEFEMLERSMQPDVSELLEEFGEELLKLGEPVWKLQKQALAKAPFIVARQQKRKGVERY